MAQLLPLNFQWRNQMKHNPRSVLVIDQDSDWLKFCTDSLSVNDLNIITFHNLQEAMHFLSKDFRVEIDLMLVGAEFIGNDETGLEIISQAIKEREHLIVILLFALDPPLESLRIAFQSGVNDCVRKPFNEDSLFAIIDQALAEQRINLLASKEQIIPNSILIVDDDDSWLSTMVSNLPPIEHVDIATSYQLAIEKIKLQKFDIVVSDLRLNDNDDRDLKGLDLIRNIRKHDQLTNTFTAIIIVSAYGTPSLIRDSYRKFQINYFFNKKYLSIKKYKESINGALTYNQNKNIPRGIENGNSKNIDN